LCLGCLTFGRELDENASTGQLEDNLGATGWALTTEELDLLDEASSFDVGYPYEFIRRISKDR
jgi:hypothetical protein